MLVDANVGKLKGTGGLIALGCRMNSNYGIGNFDIYGLG